MKIGEINKLKVKRISDIAYVLEAGDEEVFLHKKEANDTYSLGEYVDVYIYMDSKRRLAASCLTPLITASKPAFLEVISMKEGLGFFLYDGMPKDLLLSFDDIPYPESEYPKEGDQVLVSLKTTNNTFRAKLVSKDHFENYFTPTIPLNIDNYVQGIVVDISDQGITTITKDGYSVYIPNAHYRGHHRIGEALMVLVIRQFDDRHFMGSLLQTKKAQLSEDSRKVLDYLKKYKTVALGDKSDPIEIYKVFQLSKRAFKDAIGILYKERLITISDNSISLIVE